MKAVRWLRRSARKAGAPNAAAPSPAALSDLRKTLQTGSPLPSVRIIASGSPAAPPSAFHVEPVVSSPASWSDARDIAMAMTRKLLAPPPLGRLGGDAMLAVAAVPGKILEEWRHAAPGAWMAWPHAADAVHAEEMTAAQLRAARDGCS